MSTADTETHPQTPPGVVVTEAVIRAADHLGLKAGTLAQVIGVSPPTVTRMKKRRHVLDENTKPFELAVLLIRLFRSLDSIVGGDRTIAHQWMGNFNTALQTRPVDAIQNVMGLVNVISYLDARRARV